MKEQTTSCNKYELHRHHVESKKPDTKNYILYHLFEAQKQAKRTYGVRTVEVIGMVV